MDKARMVKVLKAAGLNEEGLARMHLEFERLDSEGHAEFLRWLKIPEKEALEITKASR